VKGVGVVTAVRGWFHKQPWWVRFQELNREGWGHAWTRRRVQRQILATAPVRTAAAGPVEIRVLTWRRDWVNQIWALKSFYHFAGVDYPLYIHDGGLDRGQAEVLQAHFPDARLVGAAEADVRMADVLRERGLNHCRGFRRDNALIRKALDFFAFSTAERVITLDSDVVFFRRPDELLANGRVNRFNRDSGDWYTHGPDRLEEWFGIRPVPLINTGVSSVWRESVDFAFVERCLARPEMHEPAWLTEQTILALLSTAFGVELLPDAYCVGAGRRPEQDLICKHYPGPHRRLLYEEGMRHLVGAGFLDERRNAVRAAR
jgi:hypothetical protein